jgi:hypothetical protein
VIDSPEEQIRRTLALYSQRSDARDANGLFSDEIRAAWTELFTADAQLQDQHGTYASQAAVRAALDANNARAPERRTEHLCGNVVIAVGEETAEADSDVIVCERFGDGPWTVGRIDHYTDVLRLTPDGWRFQERRIQARATASTHGAAQTPGLRLSDGEQVRRTIALAAHLRDEGLVDAWSELFAPDAVLTSGPGRYEGRAAIRGYLAARQASQPADRRTEHFCTNLRLAFDGDCCDVLTDAGIYECFGGGPWQLHNMGRYRDRLVRQGDRWLFAHRDVEG